MGSSFVIGIAGGSGSGKTTLVRALSQEFAGRICVVSQDNYYRIQDEKTPEERSRTNYDHPDALELDLLAAHIRSLKAGTPVQGPVYDFAVHNRTGQTLLLEPKPLILVEGILLFTSPALLEQLDLRLFVEADPDVRLARRVKRDVKKRGRVLEEVLMQYLQTVKPMHEQFVEPEKRLADLIIPEGGKNQAAQRVLFTYLAQWLASHPDGG